MNQCKIIGAFAIAVSVPATADVVDLTVDLRGEIGGAEFLRADFRSSGTGVIDSFVRMRRNVEEQGYNTSGRPVRYDELTDPNFTHDLLFGDIPTVQFEGNTFKQFILDINEPNGGGQQFLSLDKVNIYSSGTGSQTGDEDTLGTLHYSMSTNFGDNVVLLDYNQNTGSGQGDMEMLVPLSNFGGVNDDDFMYLYSYFGAWSSDFDSGDGFEEWSLLEPDAIPLPSGAALASLGLAGLATRRRRG